VTILFTESANSALYSRLYWQDMPGQKPENRPLSRFRSSQEFAARSDANFGIGPLADHVPFGGST
jgi:hypothetical protein